MYCFHPQFGFIPSFVAKEMVYKEKNGLSTGSWKRQMKTIEDGVRWQVHVLDSRLFLLV
jgi:hypothetical protein